MVAPSASDISFNDVLSLLSGQAVVRSIAIIAELRVPDALAAGPKSAGELARQCGAHEESLYRLMRALTAVGVFSQNDAQFSLTPLSGGSGAFIAALLGADARLHGTLFDRAPAIERSAEVLRSRQVADRCRCIAGDFFEAVPLGSEAILLSRILHDFSDEDSLRILRNCHAALPRGGRLLIVEYVVGDGAAGTAAKLFDLHMMVYFGAARERTAEEFRALLAQSGFRMQRVVESAALIGVIEAIAI